MELAAGEGGLHHGAGVDGALGAAGADHLVDLVDEDDDFAFGAADLLHDGLEPLLEFAAELGAGDERAHVEGEEPASADVFGHVVGDDLLGKAFDDCGLADAGLADEDGVVLGAAVEYLDDAADFVIAADDGIELAFAGGLGEVVAVLFERLVAFFGALAGGACAAADVLEGGGRCFSLSKPDSRRMRAASPSRSSAMAMRMCSMPTNSSVRRWASALAASSMATIRGVV